MKLLRISAVIIYFFSVCLAVNADNVNIYYYQNNNTSYSAYIFSKSLCNTPIESNLKGKAVSLNSNDSKFFLMNNQVWKQYMLFGGQVVENIPSSYVYTTSKTRTKVKIQRDPATNGCIVMIDGSDTGIHVYREN